MINSLSNLLLRPFIGHTKSISAQRFVVVDLERSVPIKSLSEIAPLQFRIERCETALLSLRLRLSRESDTIDRVERITVVLNTILQVLKSLPLPTAPIPVPVGVIMQISERVTAIAGWLAAIDPMIKLVRTILRDSIAQVDELLARLRRIDLSRTAEDQLIVEASAPAPSYELPEPAIYGIYTIKLETAGKSRLGLIRYVAIAYNQWGAEIRRSDISLTSEPTILVEQLAWDLTHP